MPSDILAQLPSDRPGKAATPELQARRDMFGERPAEPGAEIAPVDTTIGGVDSRVIDGGDTATLVYFHGGGFRMGSAAAYTAYGTTLARAAESIVVLVDYRLAPEHPFPAGLRDAAAVYHAVAATARRPVILAGDSAGAGLCASVTIAAARAGVPAPHGIAMLSPWLDMRPTASSYETGTDPIFTRDSALSAGQDYLQGHSDADPLVSPATSDLSGFPPTLVQVGSTETLLGDALGLTQRLAAAQISCSLEVYADRGHTWPLLFPGTPDSEAAVHSICRFVTRVAAEFDDRPVLPDQSVRKP